MLTTFLKQFAIGLARGFFEYLGFLAPDHSPESHTILAFVVIVVIVFTRIPWWLIVILVMLFAISHDSEIRLWLVYTVKFFSPLPIWRMGTL